LNADETQQPRSRLAARVMTAVRTVRRHPAWPLTLASLLILGALGVFADLAEDVITTDHITVVDQQWAQWLHVHGTPGMIRFMLAVSTIHNMRAITLYTVLLGSYLLWKRQRGWLICMLLVIPGGMAINTLAKHLIERPRPLFDDPIVTLATFSFPSGHVAASTLFYGVVATWLSSRTHGLHKQLPIAAAALLVITLVAASRMYLGAHFLSDVLAAFFECVAWLGVCVLGMWTIGSIPGPSVGTR
jgi:undecaprenyl-diphosphatase